MKPFVINEHSPHLITLILGCSLLPLLLILASRLCHHQWSCRPRLHTARSLKFGLNCLEFMDRSSDILPVTVTLKCHSCDLQTGWGHCERQAGGEVEIGRERAQNGKRQNSSSCFYLPPFFPVCVCIIRQVWIVVCMCVCVFVCQCVCPPGCVGQMHLTKNTIGVTHGSEWVANSAQHAHTHTHTRTRTNIRTHACLCVFVRTI